MFEKNVVALKAFFRANDLRRGREIDCVAKIAVAKSIEPSTLRVGDVMRLASKGVTKIIPVEAPQFLQKPVLG
jgi:hypothetical protein